MGKKISRFRWILLVVPLFLGSIMVLNYSKIANLGFRTYSNVFLNIFGTSEMFTKSDPLDPLVITTRLHKIQEHLNISKVQFLQYVGTYRA